MNRQTGNPVLGLGVFRVAGWRFVPVVCPGFAVVQGLAESRNATSGRVAKSVGYSPWEYVRDGAPDAGS